MAKRSPRRFLKPSGVSFGTIMVDTAVLVAVVVFSTQKIYHKLGTLSTKFTQTAANEKNLRHAVEGFFLLVMRRFYLA